MLQVSTITMYSVSVYRLSAMSTIMHMSYSSRPLQEALGSFHSSVSEITISITADSLQLTNFIENQEGEGRCMHVKLPLTLNALNVNYYVSN